MFEIRCIMHNTKYDRLFNDSVDTDFGRWSCNSSLWEVKVGIAGCWAIAKALGCGEGCWRPRRIAQKLYRSRSKLFVNRCIECHGFLITLWLRWFARPSLWTWDSDPLPKHLFWCKIYTGRRTEWSSYAVRIYVVCLIDSHSNYCDLEHVFHRTEIVRCKGWSFSISGDYPKSDSTSPATIFALFKHNGMPPPGCTLPPQK